MLPESGRTLRSKPVVLLIAAALTLSLVLGAGFIALHRLRELRGAAVELPANPLSDEQARQQVIEPARQFVQVGKLARPSADYLLLSCAGEDQPPYQGTVYLNFDVPALREIPRYFDDIAAAMTARGWTEGLAPNRQPSGRTLTKGGVTARYYRNPDLPGRGTLQIYGECRVVADHRADPTGWVDVSRELTG